MEELLFIIIQVVGEIIFPSLFEVIIDLFPGKGKDQLSENWFFGVMFFVMGLLFGALSIWLLPASFFHNDILRYGNLVLAPIASYFVSKRLAQWRNHPQPVLQARFAFTFAIGFVVVRFFFTTN